MNNSFSRLIDGVNATLRHEVLGRIEDDYARSQVFGIINLLNTFKARADWSAGFLQQQLQAQQTALAVAAEVLAQAAPGLGVPALAAAAVPVATPIAELLAARDAGNQHIGTVLAWAEAHPEALAPAASQRLQAALHEAMLMEMSIELKASPRPMFAEMSGGG